MRDLCLALRRRLSGTAKEYAFNLGLVDCNVLKVTRQEVYTNSRPEQLARRKCAKHMVAMQSIISKVDIEELELVEIIIDGLHYNFNNVAMLYGTNSIRDLIGRMGS